MEIIHINRQLRPVQNLGRPIFRQLLWTELTRSDPICVYSKASDYSFFKVRTLPLGESSTVEGSVRSPKATFVARSLSTRYSPNDQSEFIYSTSSLDPMKLMRK